MVGGLVRPLAKTSACPVALGCQAKPQVTTRAVGVPVGVMPQEIVSPAATVIGFADELHAEDALGLLTWHVSEVDAPL